MKKWKKKEAYHFHENFRTFREGKKTVARFHRINIQFVMLRKLEISIHVASSSERLLASDKRRVEGATYYM